jgi:hypothetical protein
MAIIAKNIIVGGNKLEEPKAPPVKTVLFTETKETESIDQPDEHYKHVHHGDLHRLFNTKSTYLKDMAGLDN